ncbi:hypothetical protein JL193_08970 [Polaribacter batillariae]|uniref:Uncharacterized protein n=1 Tax=Polaribacter batillariae TaxID=2808900 RepID=A0ABX7SQ97_9FLAO|nr:hypothetical protein [Polaribacter batillariae]QTD36296.1 hypothetical protein JL193_08970 [Polaribacter batillariae]
MKTKKKIFLYLSIGVFVISLTQKSYCTVGGNCEYFSGLLNLIFGWFGVFMLHFPAFTWLANPLLFISWLLYKKKQKTSLILSGISFMLMLSFLSVNQIIVNDGSTSSIVNFYGLGYWLWLFSSFIILIGNLTHMKNRKINFIKLGLFLFVATLFLWNCTLENNSYEPENIDLNNVKTVSFKDAIAHFNAKKEKIKQKKNYSKSTENKFEVTPDWNTLEYNEIAYTNAQLTTANSQINRNGQYSSQLYFINVNNHIRNVIFTIWKDEVDKKGSLINGRIYFNDLEGKFIDGYRVENGIFTKRFVVKPQIQKASFFPLFFIQQHNITEEGDCWNTDVLNDFEGGVLNEVVITAEGGGSSSTGAGHSDSYNWYYTYGPGSISYGSYINGATSTGTIGGGGSSSLSSSQVTSAAAAILMAAPIEPDENGKCPEGYEKNPTTGKCDPICTGGKIYNKTTQECECPEGLVEDSFGNCVEDPCKYIKLQIQNPNYTAQANELKGKTGLKKETGYKQNKDGNQVSLIDTNGGHSLTIPIDNNTVGYMHTHLNNFIEINQKTGKEELKKPIKMFSPADIINFLQMVRNTKFNGVPTHLVYATMISSSGNYTLRFTGNVDDNFITNANMLNSPNSYKTVYETYIKDKGEERGFLHFMKDYIKIKDINLYRIRDNGDTEKKTLKTNGKVDTNDC